MDESNLEISCRELQTLLASDDPPLVVDCREPEEHAIVALPDALLIPMSQWRERHTELDVERDRAIVVYCHLGARSQRVASWLRDHGFADVRSLAGGIDAWAGEIEPGMRRY